MPSRETKAAGGERRALRFGESTDFATCPGEKSGSVDARRAQTPVRIDRSPEFDCLCRCAHLGRHESTPRPLRDDLNWDTLVLLARLHGLTPVLYRALSALGPSGAPPAVVDKLRVAYEAQRFRNLFLATELLRALRTLDAAGVTAIPYKGPALAVALYGDLALRQFNDLDLLVKPRDAVEARRALVAGGFVPERRLSDVAVTAYAHLHSQFAFTTGEGQARIEINWRTAPWYFRLPEIPGDVWGRLGRLSLAGNEVPWPAPEDLLFLLCLHGGKHGWDTLKWIVDIARLLERHPNLDWSAVALLTHRTGTARLVALGLSLAHDLLDAPPPPAAFEPVAAAPSVASLAAQVRTHLRTRGSGSVDTQATLAFLGRATERFDTKLFCRVLLPVPYFLLHRLARPSAAALLTRRRP